VGLMNWLMKGIGFEDEEDQEAESLRVEQKLKKQQIKEAKRKEKEAAKLERENAKLEKANSRLSKYDKKQKEAETSSQRSYASDPDQFNMSSSSHSQENSENYGGYGTEYTTVGGNVGGYGSKNVVFFYPKSYDEVQHLIDYLKQGESVMLNLDNISDSEAQRMLDFASGSVYALNGSIQRVSGNIFLLTPEGLNIMVPKK